MDNTNYWPYTNIHELNLDWIISKVKELDTRFTDDIETFVREYIDEHFAEWTVNANYNPDDETIIYTNGTGATLTAGDVIRFAIDNAFVNVKDPTARTAAGAAQTTANNAGTAAAAAQSTADSAVTAAASAQSTADDAAADIAALSNFIQATQSTVDLSVSGTVFHNILVKSGHAVHLNLSVSNISVDGNSVIGVIPEGYRPSISATTIGLVIYNNATIPSFIDLTANGNIKLSVGSGTVTRVLIDTCYITP